MAPAVDGRIVTRDWPLPAGLTAEYEGTAAALRGDAWIIGRVSMEPGFLWVRYRVRHGGK